jgi:hypothetical protein
MNKTKPISIKEILDLFVPGKLYWPTINCITWFVNSSSGYGMKAIHLTKPVIYIKHEFPFSTTNEVKLTFLSQNNFVFVYINTKSKNKFYQEWINGIIEL